MQKFIVISIQRTGSTYLSTNLNNHPNIRMHGEIFLRNTLPSKDGFTYYLKTKKPTISQILLSKNFSRINKILPFLGYFYGNYPYDYLERFYSDSEFYFEQNSSAYYSLQKKKFNINEEKAVGFKLMLSQIKQIPTLKKWVQNNKELKIIYLIRENYFKTYISHLYNKETKIAHFDKEASLIRFKINPKEALRFMDHIDKQYDEIRSIVKNTNHEVFSYEKISNNFDEEVNRIFEFLQLPKLKIEKSILKKRVKYSLKETIENFDELQMFFSTTKYAPFLKD